MPEEIRRTFAAQQAAYQADMNPSLAQRRKDLQSLQRMLRENVDDIVQAVNADFGCRSRFETEITELVQIIDGAAYARRQLRKWMRPQRRSVSVLQFPTASAWTRPQPVGVVGIVTPWNYPVAMAFQPLVSAFAAGNRAMVKMSENSRHLAQLLIKLSPQYFPQDKLAFFDDTGGRGAIFTAVPFNHLFFTGSSETGKAVMANAARNLTPVTLEMGGKSPAVVGPTYDIATAAARIMWAKTVNAGQICTNVDYLFLPEGKTDEFICAARAWVNKHIPDINSGDYTSIIDDRSYERLKETELDAFEKGATLVDLYEGPAPDESLRLLPPRIIRNATDHMKVMQREIFGPLLPVITYRNPQDVIDYINARPRPLGLYIFSNDKALQKQFLSHTISGSVGINEAVVQAALNDLPFGGSGHSGMGHYHSHEGFLTFSKLRPVFKQGPFRSLNLLLPPYSGRSNRLIKLLSRINGLSGAKIGKPINPTTPPAPRPNGSPRRPGPRHLVDRA